MTDKTINFLNLLGYALQNYPEKLVIHPILPNTMAVARQNDKRPAYIQFAVPDPWIPNIRGNENLTDIYACIQIDREVLERMNSKIILPSEDAATP